MVNIPVNLGGTFLTASQSVTGAFSGMICLGTGSATAITGSIISGIKYGYAFTNNVISEAVGVPFTMAPGTTFPMVITSCSLAAGSAPVFLYS
jgi:hypothetical protein